MRYLYRLRAYLINYIPFLGHTLAALVPLAVAHAMERLTFHWLMIPAALLLGNLPDIDTSYSRLGRLVPRLSKYIEHHYGHRSVTHSLWPVLGIGLGMWITSSIWEPWPWWVWPTLYLSHLVLDMVVGVSGVPLLWPHPARFYYLRSIKSGTAGEKVVTLGLLFTVTGLLWYGAPDPSQWIVQASGNLDYAISEYRQMEPFNEAIAVIEGTVQETHQAISGRFRVIDVNGSSFTLDNDGQLVTAGRAGEDIYVRHIVIEPGASRLGQAAVIPTFTPTPVIVPVKIGRVYDIGREVLVDVGDTVVQGQVLADLVVAKETLLAPVPTTTDTPVPLPTWTPTPYSQQVVDPLMVKKAWADLELARARYSRVVAPPSQEEIDSVCSRLEAMRNDLWADQLARDALKIQANSGGVPWERIGAAEAKLMEQERQIALQETACTEIQHKAHRASSDEIAIAQAQLQQAEVIYAQRVAAPTPRPTPIPLPTATPVPSPTPTTTPDVSELEVRSLLDGQVIAVHVVSVNGNEATVQIDVQVEGKGQGQGLDQGSEEGLGQTQGTSAADLSLNLNLNLEPVRVFHVSDGDTLDVRFGDGREERLRLLDVDTPETVHPSKGVECYGPEASKYTKLTFCENETGKGCDVPAFVWTDGRGKYGRLLAYIWTEEGALHNEMLVQGGYARHNDYGQMREFSAQIAGAERWAQENGMGMWGACGE